jgi:hypothetical protein
MDHAKSDSEGEEMEFTIEEDSTEAGTQESQSPPQAQADTPARRVFTLVPRRKLTL